MMSLPSNNVNEKSVRFLSTRNLVNSPSQDFSLSSPHISVARLFRALRFGFWFLFGLKSLFRSERGPLLFYCPLISYHVFL